MSEMLKFEVQKFLSLFSTNSVCLSAKCRCPDVRNINIDRLRDELDLDL